MPTTFIGFAVFVCSSTRRVINIERNLHTSWHGIGIIFPSVNVDHQQNRTLAVRAHGILHLGYRIFQLRWVPKITAVFELYIVDSEWIPLSGLFLFLRKVLLE
jgi:hypothetical protein